MVHNLSIQPALSVNSYLVKFNHATYQSVYRYEVAAAPDVFTEDEY